MSGFFLIDFNGISRFEFFDSCGAESLIEEAPGDFEFIADSAINCSFDGSCIEEAWANITSPVTEISGGSFCLIDINGISSFAFSGCLGVEYLIEDAPHDYDFLADAAINCTFDGSSKEGCVIVTSQSLSEILANVEKWLVLEVQPNSSWRTDGVEGERLVSTEAIAWSSKNKQVERIPVLMKNNTHSKSAPLLKAVKSSQNISLGKLSRPKKFTSKPPVPSRNLVAKSLAKAGGRNKLLCVKDIFAGLEKIPELKANNFTSVKWKVNPLYLENDKTSFEKPAVKGDSDSQSKRSCSTACSKDLKFIKPRIDGKGVKKSVIPSSGGSRQRLMTLPIKLDGSRCDYTGKISCQHSSWKKKECTAPLVDNHPMLNKRVPMLNKRASTTGKGIILFEKSSALSRRKRIEDDLTNGTKPPGKLLRTKNFTSKPPVPSRNLVTKSLAQAAQRNKRPCVKDIFAGLEKSPELKANNFASVKWKVNPLYLENDKTSFEKPAAKDDSDSQSKRNCFTACSKDLKFIKPRGVKKSVIPRSGGSRQRLMTVPIKPDDSRCDYTGKISCQHSSWKKKECTAPLVDNHPMLNKRASTTGKGIILFEKSSALSMRKRIEDDLTNGTKPPGKLLRTKNFTSKPPVPSRNLVAKSLAQAAQRNKLPCVKDIFAGLEKIPELKANNFASVKWKVNPLYLENDKTSFQKPAAKDDSDSQSKRNCFTACSKDLKFIKPRIYSRGMKKNVIPGTGGRRQRLMTVPIKPYDSRCDYTRKISCQHSSWKKKECTAPSINNHPMLKKRVPMLKKAVPSTGKGIVFEKSSALSRMTHRRIKGDLTDGTKPAFVAFSSQTGTLKNKDGEWLFSWEEACRWRAEIMSNVINEEEWLVSWEEACRWRHERMAKEGEWLFSWDEACKWREELSSRKIKNKFSTSMKRCISS